jgi:tetratricopeptide (TPR) repeat protein
MQAGELKPATLALLYHSRARLHLLRSDRKAAVRDLADAAQLAENDRPLKARVEGDRGRVLHLQEQYAGALTAYEAALKDDPKRLDVVRWRGEVLLVQKEYSKAAAAFDAYLEKGGTPSVAVYRQRGLARSKLRQHAEAVEDYSQALYAKPKDKERLPLILWRGEEYLAMGAVESALHDFNAALGLDPKNADASLGRAYVRVKLGEPQKGVADAERVVKGEPKEPRLWHGAARSTSRPPPC